ncbi:hypothetical protein H8356DRAFT_1337338 [Neocallimastix lanati (nom. inval.)]|nr:hypothetical protein H8356DRAFT_1337338 [Neocallimastix sp. JGI-2020a]
MSNHYRENLLNDELSILGGDISISVNTEDFGLPHIVIWVKETPYRSTLRDPRESRANYRWRPCHPRGAGNCKSSQTRLTQWDSYRKNREDLILVGVDPETI